MSDENRIKQFMQGNANTGLQINITNEKGRVHIVFDKPVLILDVTAEQALGMAMALLGQVGHVTWPKEPPSPIAPIT